MTDTQKPHYYGHRQRLRHRFLDAMGDGLADYEILELLLQYAIPRRDVKPIAKSLIAQFGSIRGVMGASLTSLTKIDGIGENTAVLLKVAHKAVVLASKQEIQNTHILGTWDKVIEYCTLHMAYTDTEQFRVIFLNSRNRIIVDEVQTTGSINETAIYPREVVKRALELGAVSVIMVHNHPSGDATPSQADIDMTYQVKDACATVNIKVHDHIVISKENVASFKTLGIL